MVHEHPFPNFCCVAASVSKKKTPHDVPILADSNLGDHCTFVTRFPPKSPLDRPESDADMDLLSPLSSSTSSALEKSSLLMSIMVETR
jgi:hypothetical protein